MPNFDSILLDEMKEKLKENYIPIYYQEHVIDQL